MFLNCLLPRGPSPSPPDPANFSYQSNPVHGLSSYGYFFHFPLLHPKRSVKVQSPRVAVRDILIFYGKDFLVSRQTPKMVDHPLSAVRHCLFSTSTAALYIWRPSATFVTAGFGDDVVTGIYLL